ncbi:hypothetical protein HF086_006927 [Spodoptera exigua]|uniref:Uncharacterized protein n=1 Tax=Spodoptera exigua TaxID=7107 RepID=A0A922MIG3_SPOEX|nr:hypothetical protein HF086_006927 [Spodoptera exigua]
MALTKVVTVLLLVQMCLSAPVDDPIRIDLPVYDQPQAGSDVLQNQPLDPENYPGGDHLSNNGGNLITYKVQAAQNLLEGTLNAKANVHQDGLFAAPVSTLETALQESEGFGSKKLSIKENIQGVVAGIFQVPGTVFKQIARVATEKLNNLGGKLIGL